MESKEVLDSTSNSQKMRLSKNDKSSIFDRLVYAIDNSFNAIGKKKFVVVKLENITKDMNT